MLTVAPPDGVCELYRASVSIRRCPQLALMEVTVCLGRYLILLLTQSRTETRTQPDV